MTTTIHQIKLLQMQIIYLSSERDGIKDELVRQRNFESANKPES